LKDYWAADLPVQRRLNNFDRVGGGIDYRDTGVSLGRTFKAGQFDFIPGYAREKLANGL